KQYPNSPLAANAQTRLSELQQIAKDQEAQRAARQAWDKIRDMNDQTALQGFMRQYPNSPLVLDAQRRLSELQQIAKDQEAQRAAQQAWDKIRDSIDQAALQGFMRQYPNSPLVLDAQRRLSELQRIVKDQEAQRAVQQAWERLKDSSDQAAL